MYVCTSSDVPQSQPNYYWFKINGVYAVLSTSIRTLCMSIHVYIPTKNKKSILLWKK